MKLATLLIPAYLPRAYVGATPAPYQSGTVDAFEKGLAALSPLVVRHANVVRLKSDPAGRFVNQEIVTEYDLMWDAATDSLGQAIALSLKSFNLNDVTVICHGDAQPFTAADAEEIKSGLHPWCEE